MRESIRSELTLIEPADALESEHLAQALAWVDSGAELFRIVKPATPPMHLVAYFAVVDGQNILLVDHKDAQLWLPSGGHVESGEHPRDTVVRELKEELGFTAAHPISRPLMVTCRETEGISAGHIDVSLWYVVRASRQQVLAYDPGEFKSISWFSFAETPFHRSDPHLRRFINKLSHSR
jgi:8-oxo-dGTP diphosphatase